MPSRPVSVYWDSCVFIDLINGSPDRAPTARAILEEVAAKQERRVLTSVLAKVEVAFSAEERATQQLDAQARAAIDAFWADGSVIEIVELHDFVADSARDLMRYSISQGWRLTPLDAIHLASAQWAGATEIHTYDTEWARYAPRLGCRICEPYVQQPPLPLAP